jgi:hypothetical protein
MGKYKNIIKMKVSSVNDLSKKVFSGSSYRTNKLVPLSGSQTQSLSLTGTTNIQFEIPTQCVNLSKSRLAFDVLFSASSGRIWCYADPLSLFSRVQLLTRSGTSLADITDCNKFSSLLQPVSTPNSELLQRSQGGCAASSTRSVDTVALSAYSPIQGIQVSGMPYYVTTSDSGLTATGFALAETTGNVRYDNTKPESAYNEQRYLFSGNSDTGALALSYQIALETIESTILGVNKTLYFGENIILSLTFAPVSQFAWISAAITSCVATGPVVNPTTVSNLSLYLKVEQNPAIIQGFQQKLQSPEGLTIVTPYVYTTKVNTGASSTSSSINFRLNRGYGERLLRCLSSVFNNTEQYNTTLDRGNVASAKVTSYRTLINSVQLQDYSIDCTRSEDWLVNSDLLEGSSITSSNQYKYLFTHIDDFSGKSSVLDEEGDDTLISGRDVSEEQLYQIVYNTVSGQYNLFTVLVMQRTLMIRQGMIQWV